MTIARTPFPDLPTALVTELADAGLDPRKVYDDVVAAVDEDLPGDDVTTEATVPADSVAWADLVARADGTVCGTAVAELVLRFVAGDDLAVERRVRDGEQVARGDVVLSVHGPVGLLLTAERTALNYLGHLSGVATATATWVRALADTAAQVRDTRKTVPHLRALEKYAVRCGGGVNHRGSLSDQALVKDNHVLAAGGAVEAFEAVRRRYPTVPVQVEGPRWSSSPTCSRPAPTRCCSTTWTATRCARPWRSTPGARSSRRPAGSPSSAPARSP